MHDTYPAQLARELAHSPARSILSELDERVENGLRVRLMFDRVSEVHPLYIELYENGSEQPDFLFPIPTDEWREAINHPYAYIP